MESPRNLIDQAAKERGVSANSAKRALYLQALADDGRSVREASAAFKVAPTTVKMLCRRFMIDLADYRPYSAMERKGLDRPKPFTRDIHRPASGLPLFA